MQKKILFELITKISRLIVLKDNINCRNARKVNVSATQVISGTHGWKERTNSQKLTLGLHMHTCPYLQTDSCPQLIQHGIIEKVNMQKLISFLYTNSETLKLNGREIHLHKIIKYLGTNLRNKDTYAENA